MDHPEYFAVAFVEEVSVPRYHLDQCQLRHRQVVRAALVKDRLFPLGEGIPTRCAAPVDLPLRNLRLTWFWNVTMPCSSPFLLCGCAASFPVTWVELY